jgi:hypothetical protein
VSTDSSSTPDVICIASNASDFDWARASLLEFRGAKQSSM